MTHHTPEPWVVAAKALVRLDHAYLIEPVDHHDFEYGPTLAATSQQDARRIVACVNACAGWETNQLEAMELGSLKESLVRVMEQRDHLLDALHDAATSLETIQLRSFGEDRFLDSKPEMRSYAGSRAAVARESIDKAKGGSAITKITGENK